MVVKDKRLSLGMLQSDLARSVGVSRSTVAMWETGKAFPRIEVLFNLSLALNCSLSELLEGWRDEGKK